MEGAEVCWMWMTPKVDVWGPHPTEGSLTQVPMPRDTKCCSTARIFSQR